MNATNLTAEFRALRWMAVARSRMEALDAALFSRPLRCHMEIDDLLAMSWLHAHLVSAEYDNCGAALHAEIESFLVDWTAAEDSALLNAEGLAAA